MRDDNGKQGRKVIWNFMKTESTCMAYSFLTQSNALKRANLSAHLGENREVYGQYSQCTWYVHS